MPEHPPRASDEWQQLDAAIRRAADGLTRELQGCDDHQHMLDRLQELRWPTGPSGESEDVTVAVRKRIANDAVIRACRRGLHSVVSQPRRRAAAADAA